MASLPMSNAPTAQFPRPKLYRARERRNRNGHPYLMNPRPTCPYCDKSFVTDKAFHQHMALQLKCRQAEQQALEEYMRQRTATGIGGMCRGILSNGSS